MSTTKLDLLYIEDNPDEADVFKRVVSHLPTPPNYVIISNGSDALDYLTQKGIYEGQPVLMPRFVLIDLNLPGHSGFDIIQQVRSMSQTRYLPLVVYSSSDNPKDIRRAYDLGVNAYLIKPGSYHEVSHIMRGAIEFWLAQSQYIP